MGLAAFDPRTTGAVIISMCESQDRGGVAGDVLGKHR
jgi:hypothetical protein